MPKAPRFAEKFFSANLGDFGEVRRIKLFLFGCGSSALCDIKVKCGDELEDIYMDIFICYAREDRRSVFSIYRILTKNGFSCWFDNKNLLPGQNWEHEIETAIRTCKIFIACLSTKGMAKRGYVHAELKKAYKILDTLPDGAVYIIPVRLDDCMMPSKISHLHWVDFFVKEGRQLLIKAVSNCLDKNVHVKKQDEVTPQISKPRAVRKQKSPSSHVHVRILAPNGEEYDGVIDVNADYDSLLSTLIKQLELSKNFRYQIGLLGGTKIREGVTIQVYPIGSQFRSMIKSLQMG